MSIKKQFVTAFLLLLFTQIKAFEVKIKVFMEGPFQGSLMTTHLVSELKKNYPQTPNDAVDIVNVEIRTQLQGNAVETKKAFLLKDGSVVDLVSLQPTLNFNATGNAYFVIIKHRNHLPIASKHLINHQTVCDLTQAQNVYGDSKTIQGKVVMIAGNVYNDSTGFSEINSSDYFMVSKAKDNHLSGYIPEDINLDGLVNEKDFQMVKNNSEKLYFSQIQ